MFGYLVGAVTLSFLLLCLDAVGLLALSGFVEKVLQYVFVLGLVAGDLVFGWPFLRRLFGP